MSEINERREVKVAGTADNVLLRPSDIAILVVAARGVVDRMKQETNSMNAPSDCYSAVSSAADWRINRLIQQLEKCAFAGDEVQVELPYGDRNFFAEVLYSYCDQAQSKVYLRGWNSVSREEATSRSRVIAERYVDIFNRLGGSGWTLEEHTKKEPTV